MNWNNLKDYKCPKCNGNLKEEKPYHICVECKFKIGDSRYAELLRDKPKYIIYTEESNLSELNNY